VFRGTGVAAFCGSGTDVVSKNEPYAPNPPGAPAGPVAPATPGGPAAPSAPVAPRGPGSPATPAGPDSPDGPAGPATPCAPVAPTGPCGPRNPVGPITVAIRSSRVATKQSVVTSSATDTNSAVATRTTPTNFPCRHASTAKSAPHPPTGWRYGRPFLSDSWCGRYPARAVGRPW